MNLPSSRTSTSARYPVRPTRMIFSLALVIVLLSWYVPIWMQAAASDLDPAFGNGGIVITDFFGSDDIAYAMARQPNGRLVAAGVANSGPGSNDFALARYNRNGSLDTSFGSNGFVITDIGNRAEARAMVLQPDGDIVLAGLADENSGAGFDFGLVRYEGK